MSSEQLFSQTCGLTDIFLDTASIRASGYLKEISKRYLNNQSSLTRLDEITAHYSLLTIFRLPENRIKTLTAH
ncbi:MAG: hypothetical protein IKX14_01910 [Neisseriaceae bacterium]|nr:hypothetical protein [Neisseriaceae bacterium]